MTTENNPRVSVVSPTYQEVENIPLLAARVNAALANDSYELLIVDDDSGDGTAAVCAQLAKTLPVRLLSRTENRGLSPAVIDGITHAKGEFVVVIDADLSHPPEKISEIVTMLANGEADFVVGSRYVKGGELDEDWPWYRKINSLGATLLAKPLVPLADPMSGFFALRRDGMPQKNLSPIGYKIGLEIAVKAGWPRERIREAPIRFDDRQHGKSKMTMGQQFNYLRHLRRLYHYRWPKRMELLQFTAVGGSGFVLDVAAYFALLAVGVPHLAARALAFWPAVTSNWFLNRIMTFKTRVRTEAKKQWFQYVAVSIAGFAINWGTYAGLTLQTEFFAEQHFVALMMGVLAGTAFNFISSDWLVFKKQ